MGDIRRILIVEDDAPQAETVIEALERAGWKTGWAATLADAVRQASHFDLLLVDRKLPDGDGLSLLAMAAAGDIAAPIILLTAQNTIDQRVMGLEQGAVDYVGKGVDPREIVLRCEAQWQNIERSRAMPVNLIQIGRDDVKDERLVISPIDRIVARADRAGALVSKSERKRFQLEPTAFMLLVHLVNNADTTISIEELERRFFHKTEHTRQSLRNAISKIRARIDKDYATTFLHTYLARSETERSGYCFASVPTRADMKYDLRPPAS